MKINQILLEFNALSQSQKEHVIELLIDNWNDGSGGMEMILEELDSVRINLPECVHCQKQTTIKRAKIKGIQRYSCKSCGKYWMATHGTGLSGLQKKSLWEKYIKVFLMGFSIRKAALEVGVCIQTSFRWRHRLLSSISCYIPDKIGGIIETVDFQMPYSSKGERKKINHDLHSISPKVANAPSAVSVIISVCRGKQETVSSVIKDSNINPEQVKKAMAAKILHGSVQISRDKQPFAMSSNKDVVEHLFVTAEDESRPKALINLKAATFTQIEFFRFLVPFRGVATKYLPNYLNWHHYKEYTKKRYDKVRLAMSATLGCNNARDWLENLIQKDIIIIT